MEEILIGCAGGSGRAEGGGAGGALRRETVLPPRRAPHRWNCLRGRLAALKLAILHQMPRSLNVQSWTKKAV